MVVLKTFYSPAHFRGETIRSAFFHGSKNVAALSHLPSQIKTRSASSEASNFTLAGNAARRDKCRKPVRDAKSSSSSAEMKANQRRNTLEKAKCA